MEKVYLGHVNKTPVRRTALTEIQKPYISKCIEYSSFL